MEHNLSMIQITTNDSIKIGTMTLGGRIVMPPMGTYKASEDGKVSRDNIDYYTARASNPHVQLIITEHSYVSFTGKSRARQLGIDSDDKIKGLHQLVDAIHQHDTRVIAQLNHAGAQVRTLFEGQRPLAASAVPTPIPPAAIVTPEPMTEEDIKQTISDFAQAARRAQAAGFDGVEIHCAHGYLLNQFLSPLSNHRTDRYGGSLENRARLPMEVYRAVRKQVGNDYTVSVRLSTDYVDGGTTIEESVQVAQWLAAEGVDLLNLTGGMTSYMRKGHTEPGYFQDFSRAVKEVVTGTPVLLTGGVKNLAQAEELLETGAAHLIGVGRQLMINPNWENQ